MLVNKTRNTTRCLLTQVTHFAENSTTLLGWLLMTSLVNALRTPARSAGTTICSNRTATGLRHHCTEQKGDVVMRACYINNIMRFIHLFCAVDWLHIHSCWSAAVLCSSSAPEILAYMNEGTGTNLSLYIQRCRRMPHMCRHCRVIDVLPAGLTADLLSSKPASGDTEPCIADIKLAPAYLCSSCKGTRCQACPCRDRPCGEHPASSMKLWHRHAWQLRTSPRTMAVTASTNDQTGLTHDVRRLA
jgi:hypothetical protein